MFNFDKKIKNILKKQKSTAQSFLTTPVLKGMGGRTTPLHPSRIHPPELIKGGLGDNKPNSMFNQKQLAMGRKAEMEHTTNSKIANEIAKDHLTEFPNYYTHLARMEKKLKKTNRKDFHSQTTTPMMDYPADYGVVGKTIKMSPDEFIRRTQSETEQSRNMSQAEYEKSFLGHDKSYMDKLAQAIKSPEPLVNMPYLETKEGIQSEHEGRNRALAARMAGKKTIPVRVVETDRRYIQEKGLRSQYTRDEENKMFRDREQYWEAEGEHPKEPVQYSYEEQVPKTFPRSDVRWKDRKTVPYWLLKQLNDKEQIEAIELLQEDYKSTDLAKQYNVYNPYIGKEYRSSVFMTNEQMLNVLKEYYNKTGKTPKAKDIDEMDGVPSHATYNRRFGSFNNALILAGLNINVDIPTKKNVVERFEKYGPVTSKKEYKKEYKERPETIKKEKEYYDKYSQTEEYKKRHRENEEKRRQNNPEYQKEYSKYHKEYYIRPGVAEGKLINSIIVSEGKRAIKETEKEIVEEIIDEEQVPSSLPRSDIIGQKIIPSWVEGPVKMTNTESGKLMFLGEPDFSADTVERLSPESPGYEDAEDEMIEFYGYNENQANQYRKENIALSNMQKRYYKDIKEKIKSGHIENVDDYRRVANPYSRGGFKGHSTIGLNQNELNKLGDEIVDETLIPTESKLQPLGHNFKETFPRIAYQNLMGDDDDDGVNNSLDCNRYDKTKQGYIHNGQAVLYHGTTKDNAKRIVKAGLKAQENMFGEPAVFLTPSFQHAVYHGTKKKYVDPNVKPAVLEVSVPKEETGLTDEQIRDEEHPLREVRIYRNVPAKNIKLSRKQIKTAWGDSDKDGIPNVFDKPKMVRAEVKKKKKLIGGIGIIREKLDMGGEYGTLDTVDEEGTITNTAGKHLTGAYWEFEPDSKITLEKVKKKRKDFDYLVSLKSKADADKLKKEFDELYRPDMFGGKNPSVSYYDDKTLMINIPYSGMKRYRQNDLYEAAVDEKDTGRVIYNFAEAANVHLTRVKKIGITRQNENKLSKETTMEGTTDAAHRAYLVQKGLQDNMSPEEFKEYYTKHRGHLENKKKRKDFEYLVSGNEKDINELKRDVWKDYPEAKIITTNKGTIVSFPYKFIKNMRDELYTDYGEYVDDVGEYMKYIFTTDTKRKLEFKPIGVTKQEQQRLDRTHNKETIKTENKNMFINLVNAQDEKRESEKKMAEEGKKILEPHIQKIMKKHNVSKQDAELYLTLAFSKFEIKSDNDIELAVDDIIKETDERRKRK